VSSFFQWISIYGCLLFAACSVDKVNFVVGEERCDVEGDEDGNGMADCADPACAGGPGCCGDNVKDPTEACDEGGVSTMTCDLDCSAPACNDGVFNALAETCDDGGNTASCDSDCSKPLCGDSLFNAAANEQCDQGREFTAQCDTDCTLPACNDGLFNPLVEDRDPPQSPSATVPVSDQSCRYDFSAITQLYCNGGCGGWGGGNGCQQEDADAFCKLKLNDSKAVATSFTQSTAAAAPGICCPIASPPTGCIQLGSTITSRGIVVPVSVIDTSLLATHGAGAVVTNVVCAVP
jgi:hypothetical protein